MHGVQSCVKLPQDLRFILGYNSIIGGIRKACDDPHIISARGTSDQEHISISVSEGIDVVVMGVIYLYIHLDLII